MQACAPVCVFGWVFLYVLELKQLVIALRPLELKIFKSSVFKAPKLHLGYETRCSGLLRINCDSLRIFNVHGNLDTRAFSSI